MLLGECCYGQDGVRAAQGEAPSAAGLGWAGLGNQGLWVGRTSTPSAWGTAMASWPLATHWGLLPPSLWRVGGAGDWGASLGSGCRVLIQAFRGILVSGTVALAM